MSTPQNPFAQPDKGDRFTPRDNPHWIGRLFLIYPDSVGTYMGQGKNGQPPEQYEAVTGDVVIIDLVNPETGQPTTLSSARIGGKSLVPQIKKHCGGGMVLGRLTQGQASGEKSGAYFLAEYSDADQQMAMQYIAAHPRNQFAQPQAQAPAPQGQPQPWGQAPPAAGPYQGQGGPVQQGTGTQPQYASQALPYDPWQGTQTAQPQAAPQGPPQGQWGAPAGTAQGAPAQMPPASASAWQAPPPNGQQPSPQAAPSNPAAMAPAAAAPLDPQLVAFLQSKGVPNVESMSDGQARMIAATFT